MADEPRYADEIRIPISITLPWSGRLTRDGTPWPRDKHGRDWPTGRAGRPEFPIDLLPHGFAPGTNAIYRNIALHGAVTVTKERPLTRYTRVMAAVDGAAFVELLLSALPEFLLLLAIGAEIYLVVGSDHYTFKNSAASRRWAFGLAGQSPPDESFPSAPPIPPLPPTQPGPDLPNHTGHPGTTVRLPALTPGSIPPDLPAVQPGTDMAELGPFILESRRNKGLEGDARTATDRARKAARRADPEVTQALPEAEWRAHHLIPLELLRVGNRVLKMALKAGWRTDEDSNMAALPNSAAAQSTLRRAGIERPVDDSGHPTWNKDVEARLRTIEDELDRDYGKRDSPEKDKAARAAVEALCRDLRHSLPPRPRISGVGGINDPSTT